MYVTLYVTSYILNEDTQHPVIRAIGDRSIMHSLQIWAGFRRKGILGYVVVSSRREQLYDDHSHYFNNSRSRRTVWSGGYLRMLLLLIITINGRYNWFWVSNHLSLYARKKKEKNQLLFYNKINNFF